MLSFITTAVSPRVKAASMRFALGRQTDLFEADLRHVEKCFKLVDFASERLGGLDILVNNAGLTETKPFSEFTSAVAFR